MRRVSSRQQGKHQHANGARYWENGGEHRKPWPHRRRLFFESNGEQWAVWEQVKPVIGAWRAMFSSPHFLGNLGNTMQGASRLGGKSAAPGPRCHFAKCSHKCNRQAKRPRRMPRAARSSGSKLALFSLTHFLLRGSCVICLPTRVDNHKRRTQHDKERDGTFESCVASKWLEAREELLKKERSSRGCVIN